MTGSDGSADGPLRAATAVERLRTLVRTPGGSLLVLRAFLGVTFTFAGLQKLANRDFFRASAPGSFQAQLRGAMATSPIRPLLSAVDHAAVLVAVLIALAEVAVGIGTLLGRLGRIAAAGGMLLSLSFFLTISYSTRPYYYGSDIVFLFAWTPFVLGGSGPFSLDARLARAHRQARLRSPEGTPEALIDRRAAIRRVGTVGVVAAVAAVAAGMAAAIGRLASSGTSGTTSGAPSLGTGTTTGGGARTSTTASRGKAPGVKIGPASAVPVGGAASFVDPVQHIPAYVLQPEKGTFVAFSAVCTHAGCTVGFERSAEEFLCPCHGSIYDAKTGAVLQGPAPSPLPRLAVAEGGDGELYVDS